MLKHKETGVNGEQIAENFLKNNGYRILHKNWQSGKKEVDLIATSRDLLVFVEVKTRTGCYFGFPEDAIGFKKQENLKQAAADYLDKNPQWSRVQFDIISIVLKQEGHYEIVHFTDAF